MAQNEAIITLTEGAAWQQITNSDVSALRVQLLDGESVWLKATVGAVAPAAVVAGTLPGGIRLTPALPVIAANLLIAELFPGVPGATRVYAYTSAKNVTLAVSHA